MKYLQSSSLEILALEMDWDSPTVQFIPTHNLAIDTALRNYLILTHSQSPQIQSLDYSERFIGRYRWLYEYAERKKKAIGQDAGLDQMVFQLIEEGANSGLFDQWYMIENIQEQVLMEI